MASVDTFFFVLVLGLRVALDLDILVLDILGGLLLVLHLDQLDSVLVLLGCVVLGPLVLLLHCTTFIALHSVPFSYSLSFSLSRSISDRGAGNATPLCDLFSDRRVQEVSVC